MRKGLSGSVAVPGKPLEKPRVEAAGEEIRLGHNFPVYGNGGRDALHDEHVESANHAADSFGASQAARAIDGERHLGNPGGLYNDARPRDNPGKFNVSQRV